MKLGCCLWFTGLPSSGKTTIAHALEKELRATGRKVEVLDGDAIRTNLSAGAGFSKEDRLAHIRRIAYVAKLLSRNEVITICSVISPYREMRDQARAEIPEFVEVFVKCPVEECIRRDVKGLYKKALSGEITNMTGIQAPYEEPLAPELVIPSSEETVEASVARVVQRMTELGYVEPPQVYSEEEERIIEKRLGDLGYL